MLYIAIGLFSAFLQSSSYIFSRQFVVKHKSPLKLMIYSQLIMGVLGLLTLLVLSPFVKIVFTWNVILWMVLFAFGGCLGAFCFFRALEDIEASRLSSLMGLKLLVLTPLNCLVVHKYPGLWQYAAVLLATISAVGMNFTGGSLKLRGCIHLLVTLLCYSLTDIAAAMLTASGVNSLTVNSIVATCLAFVATAAAPAFMLCKIKFESICFRDSAPYGVLWFVAMIFLFASFSSLGVLYGTIIQATRGLISVVLGALLYKFGFDKLEPQVPVSAWIRRFIMAMLMIAALTIYNIR